MKLLDRLEVLLVITDTIPFTVKQMEKCHTRQVTDNNNFYIISINYFDKIKLEYFNKPIAKIEGEYDFNNPKSYEVYTNENKKIISC